MKSVDNKIKQVIVMRKDLGMRKGKMCAQAAHASLGAIISLMEKSREMSSPVLILTTYTLRLDSTSIVDKWLNRGMTKIVVYVNSEEELLQIKNLAEHLPSFLVCDAGLTEFKEPTYTCIAIGPAPSEEIDIITGALPLL